MKSWYRDQIKLPKSFGSVVEAGLFAGRDAGNFVRTVTEFLRCCNVSNGRLLSSVGPWRFVENLVTVFVIAHSSRSFHLSFAQLHIGGVCTRTDTTRNSPGCNPLTPTAAMYAGFVSSRKPICSRGITRCPNAAQ
jgi:hypothetical protein